MATIFTQIYKGELPGVMLIENSDFFVLFTHEPHNPGHILVIPKKEYEYIFDMPQDEYDALLAYTYELAPRLREATGAKKIGMVVEGFGVAHVHVHLVPLYNPHELDSSHAKRITKEEQLLMKEKILPFFK